MLKEMKHIPEALLDARAEELSDILQAPSLFHLDGEKPQPLFISTLLHGNETTGLYAIQRLLKKYRNRPLPRAISLFIGNVAAAKDNQRHLDWQPDYNRIWPGTTHSDSAEKDMMQTVTHIMHRKKPFASIDIHNNTGRNPHYACTNNLNPHALMLASAFSNIAVYFTNPKGVQSAAFADFCPSIVLECGQSGDRNGEDHVLHYLQKIMSLDELSSGSRQLKLYHTIARVTVKKTVTMASSIHDSGCDILLDTSLEDKNFHRLEAGTSFAAVSSKKHKPVIVSSESNEDITDEYTEIVDGRLLLKKPATLSMFTTSETAIRQDCLCYLMEELHIG